MVQVNAFLRWCVSYLCFRCPLHLPRTPSSTFLPGDPLCISEDAFRADLLIRALTTAYGWAHFPDLGLSGPHTPSPLTQPCHGNGLPVCRSLSSTGQQVASSQGPCSPPPPSALCMEPSGSTYLRSGDKPQAQLSS